MPLGLVPLSTLAISDDETSAEAFGIPIFIIESEVATCAGVTVMQVNSGAVSISQSNSGMMGVSQPNSSTIAVTQPVTGIITITEF